MTQWKPTTNMNARALRALRSMSNGSLDGSVVSAYPAKPAFLGDYEIDSGEDEGEDDQPELHPYTDYFTVPATNKFVYKLSFPPYVQTLMKIGTRNRATVHIYWNNVFQRDMAYTLSSNILTISDSRKQLRVGDEITVKYFYSDEDTEGIIVIPMDLYISQSPGGSPGTWHSGSELSPPLNQNGGTWTTHIHTFSTISFNDVGEVGYEIIKPSGIDMPDPFEIESIYWTSQWDHNAFWTIQFDQITPMYPNVFGTTRTYPGVSPFGTITAKKECGMFVDMTGDDGWYGAPVVNGPYLPSSGPTDGDVWSTGDEASRIYKQIYNGTRVRCYLSNGSSHVDFIGNDGDQCGCMGIVCFDNTIYGIEEVVRQSYDCKIGITAYITTS